MLESFEIEKSFLLQTNCLWVMNLLILINNLTFEHFSCFLKNRGLLKGFHFFLNFEKKALLNS